MLGGVVTASATRRNWAHVIDTAPITALLTLTIVSFFAAVVSQHSTPALLWGGALLALVAVQSVLLGRFGRTLGRFLLRLRTVDDLTGTPAGMRALSPARTTLTADLRRGRDPLTSARAALSTGELGLGAPATAPVSAETPRSAAALPPAVADPRRADALRPRRAKPEPVSDGYAPEELTSPSVLIVLDNEQILQVDVSLLIGRRPENRADATVHPLFAWADLSRTLSKTHALLTWSGTLLWVTDFGSANGTTLVTDGGERRVLIPGMPTAAAPGWSVELGDRSFEVRASGIVTAGESAAAGPADTLDRRTADVF
nr:RDD family protein [Cryobacterium roopkundense]